MRDFTVWVSYGKWRKNWDIRYCLLHLIHLSSTRLRRCGRILSGICEPFCLITPDLTMRYCPILILIDYNLKKGIRQQKRTRKIPSVFCFTICDSFALFPSHHVPHHPTSSHLSHHSYIFISLGFSKTKGNKMHMKTLILTCLTVLTLSACGTLTGIPSHGGGKRFAVEQELVAASARAAAKDMDLRPLAGRRGGRTIRRPLFD